GDAVYLIGYPSETEVSPDPTISEGIVSRFRDVPDFDQRFIQTDADIAGGQSGGALVDAFGRVIGVSGLSLDEAFALALDMADVRARLDALRAGGQPWTPLRDGGEPTAAITVPMHLSNARLELMWADADEEITIQVAGAAPSDLGIEVYLDDGTYLMSRSMAEVTAEWSGSTAEEILDRLGADRLIATDPDGTFRFQLPAELRASVLLTRTAPGDPLALQVTSSRPMRHVPDADEGTPITVGGRARGVVEPLEWQDRYSLGLRAGQQVRITLESAASDMAFYVIPPGSTYGPDAFFVDDSNIGIGGLDAEGVYTAEVDGLHEIVLWDNFGQAGYLLTVEEA
ncbi:MAG: trypsin-like peptidase domain-containing protein, partial [Actinomycetes bacterium]